MHNGGRLGNQVWLMMSVYAYCMETSKEFDARCFFEYQEYFALKSRSILSNLLAKVYFRLTNRYPRKESLIRKFFYEPYTTWVDMFTFVRRKSVLVDPDQIHQLTFKIFIWKRYRFFVELFVNPFKKHPSNDKPIFIARTTSKIITLPPSKSTDIENGISIDTMLKGNPETLYLYGWLFRNPQGMEKYRKAIIEKFVPKTYIIEKIQNHINEIRKDFKKIVGIHIRLGDTVNEKLDNDRISFHETEVYEILLNYLNFFKYNSDDVCFVICSDGKINKGVFGKLNITITNYRAVEDLWILSKTDTIIGADSSFAASASYLGNIPFIVFKRGTIDWEYYKDKNSFFINKYVKKFIY